MKIWLTILQVITVAAVALGQEPPKAVEPPAAAGSTVTVTTDAEFAAAIKAAQPGTQLLLDSTKTFGPLAIPDDKAGITLKPTGESVTLESRLGTPQAVEKPSLSIGLRCSDLRIERLTFRSTNESAEAIQYTLVRCGYTADNSREATSIEELPQRIEFIGCRFQGTANGNTRIGLLGNARHLAVRGCIIRDIHEVREDSQGILINNSPGPILITKCDIQAAGENILLGGSIPKIPGLQLGDLTCTDNVLSKPLEWKTSRWACKNLFELKGCTRAYVARNRMSNNWPNAQDGTAVLFTVRDKSRLADILFEGNVIENTGSGLLLTPADNLDGTRDDQITSRVVLRGNTWFVGHHDKAGGRVYTVNAFDGRPVDGLTIEGDRWFHSGPAKGSFLLFEGKRFAVTRLRLINCTGSTGPYGLIGAATAPGAASLTQFVQQADIAGNIWLGSRGAVAGLTDGNFLIEQ